MDKHVWEEYQNIQRYGWELQRQNQVRLNSGSETVKHCVAKMLAAHAGHQAGYRVASEVRHEQRGEIDVLLYGHDERITLAVECETSPTDDVIEDKVDRYIRNSPIEDIAVINVTQLPTDMHEAYCDVLEVLGL